MSIVWLCVSLWFTISTIKHGNFLGTGLMLLMGIAAAGLWFRSRMAAWVMIAFSVFGILNAFLRMGDSHWSRMGTRLCIAIGTIFLLAEYLQQLREDSE